MRLPRFRLRSGARCEANLANAPSEGVHSQFRSCRLVPAIPNRRVVCLLKRDRRDKHVLGPAEGLTRVRGDDDSTSAVALSSIDPEPHGHEQHVVIAGIRFIPSAQHSLRISSLPSERLRMPPDSLDSFIDAAAQALNIEIDATWKSAVRTNLHGVLQHAAKIDAFPLPDDAEPAPVFKA